MISLLNLLGLAASKSTAKPWNGKNPEKAMATKQNEVQQQHQLH
jgi:hypothetical protein